MDSASLKLARTFLEKDYDEKLIVTPDGAQLTDEEIMRQVPFQEHLYKSVIIK